MDANSEGRDSLLNQLPTAVVSRRPLVGIGVLAIALASVAGVGAYLYIAILSSQGLSPRRDAIALVGVLADILLISGLIVIYLRQTETIATELDVLKRHANAYQRELRVLEEQAETLSDGLDVLTEQQEVQRALYAPTVTVDSVEIAEQAGSPDAIYIDITNSQNGVARNVELRSDVQLFGTPEGYALTTGRATCPLSHSDHHQSITIPPGAERLRFGADLHVNVSESSDGWSYESIVGFSEAMQVFAEDGVEAVEVSLSLYYEDIFGSEYTEHVSFPAITLSDGLTFEEYIRSTGTVHSTGATSETEASQRAALPADGM